MTIRPSDIRILYRRELRSALRERHIVINAILVPVLLYPLLLWLMYTGFTFVFGQTEGFVSRVMIREAPAPARPLAERIERADRIEIIASPHPESGIRNGDLDVLVDLLPDSSSGVDAPDIAHFRARLTYDASKDQSRIARERVAGLIDDYRAAYLEEEAERHGIPPPQYQRFWIESRNVSTEQEMGRFLMGLLSPFLLIVMVGVGGMYTAIDATAGERENATWETLMTIATPRVNIVVAKYLYVATMATAAGLLNFAAMMVSMRAILKPVLSDEVDAMAFTAPWSSVPLILLFTGLLALFLAAGMMILASFARTFKEGQSLISPFYTALVLPVVFLQMPGFEFTMTMAAIPVVNVCMAFREAIAGVYPWPQIGLTAAVECASIGVLLWLAMGILRYEDFLMGSYSGRPGRFIKERVFARKRRKEAPYD